jgi:hypothetical protein
MVSPLQLKSVEEELSLLLLNSFKLSSSGFKKHNFEFKLNTNNVDKEEKFKITQQREQINEQIISFQFQKKLLKPISLLNEETMKTRETHFKSSNNVSINNRHLNLMAELKNKISKRV